MFEERGFFSLVPGCRFSFTKLWLPCVLDGWLHSSKDERTTLGGIVSDPSCSVQGIWNSFPVRRPQTFLSSFDGTFFIFSLRSSQSTSHFDFLSGEGYTLFSPMAGEISFDVDVSLVPAGMSGSQGDIGEH